MLHLARDADQRAFPVGHRRPGEHRDEFRRELLADARACVPERPQILGILSGEGIADDGEPHRPDNRPRRRDAELAEDSLARRHDLADLDHVAS